MTQRSHRREFLRTAGAAAGVLLAAPAIGRAGSPNEDIRIGAIGTGVRGKTLLQSLAQVKGVRVVAVCDPWEKNLAEGKAAVGTDVLAVRDYRQVLDRNDVDAVIIATPDHLHTPIAIAACAAGKDIYLEKPATHAIHEGQPLIAARDTSRRIVQVGTQQRSMPQFQQAREIVRSGRIGKVHKVQLTWNRNFPRWSRTKFGVDPASVDWKLFLGPVADQPFDDWRMLSWRGFWDFGGGIFCDLMVHHLDIVNWFLGCDQPSTVVAVGNHFSSKDSWEAPDSVPAVLEYPDSALQVHFEGNYSNARRGSSLEFMGSEATIYLDRGRFELIPERGKSIPPRELVLGDERRGADFYKNPNGEVLHLTNWIEAIRSRQQPIATLEAGISAAAAGHLANRAMREQVVVVAS